MACARSQAGIVCYAFLKYREDLALEEPFVTTTVSLSPPPMPIVTAVGPGGGGGGRRYNPVMTGEEIERSGLLEELED